MFYFLAPLKWETSEVKEFDVFLLISLSGADWCGPGVCVWGGGVTGGDWGTPRECSGHLRTEPRGSEPRGGVEFGVYLSHAEALCV